MMTSRIMMTVGNTKHFSLPLIVSTKNTKGSTSSIGDCNSSSSL